MTAILRVFIGMILGVNVLTPAALHRRAALPNEAVTIAHEPAAVPARLRILALGIDAAVEQIGLKDGNLDVPSTWDRVGWYAFGPRPGEEGLALMDGHLDSETGPAVFWPLRKANVGQAIDIIGHDGTLMRFAIRSVRTVEESDAATVFTAKPGKWLTLITCQGTWDRKVGRYDKRLVVEAELTEEAH